jgi:hypothetical protein
MMETIRRTRGISLEEGLLSIVSALDIIHEDAAIEPWLELFPVIVQEPDQLDEATLLVSVRLGRVRVRCVDGVRECD